jgi:coenzyme F420-reducing hydrogenase delta subunit
MCRGNSPATHEIEGILQNQGLKITDYVPLRLPCSGRIPTEFVLQALKLGVKNVVSIQCEDEFCRYKEGTKINARRLMLTKSLLEQLGSDKDALRVVKYSRKAIYETEKCVGCDKCVFICPYNAIEAQEFATPKIDYNLCVGCGACALVCPVLAIQIEGFAFEDVLNRYEESAKKLKGKRKLPLILVFCCQWAEFSALDDPENLSLKKKAIVLEIPCFKALDPVHVVEALHSGFDGVMAAVCTEEDCKLGQGKGIAERNMNVLQDVLKKMNLAERFELVTVSPRCVGEFDKRLDEFSKKIASMPPLKPVMVESKSHV